MVEVLNILVLDIEGPALDFALRCQDAGHNVFYYIGFESDRKQSDIGRGLVPRVENWESKMKWADLIFVADTPRHSNELERYHNEGYPIFGPNKASQELELDRIHGQRILGLSGVRTIPYVEFNDYDEAISHVFKAGEPMVSKPNGQGDRALSYVAKSPKDLIYMLRKWKKSNPLKEGFILQDKVKGVEFCVTGCFGPGGWVGPWWEGFEHKPLFSGNIGRNTGEMGTAVKPAKKSLLADLVLKPLEITLHAINYTGFIDVDCIVDSHGTPWPLEFTARPGWPMFSIISAMINGDPAKWMLDCLDGKDTLDAKNGIAIGVVITIPDFPYSKFTRKDTHDVPIWYPKECAEHIQWAQVQKGTMPNDRGKDEEGIVSAGDYLATVTGIGPNVRLAKKRAYDVVESLEIPNSPQWRDDIGEKLEEEIPKLQAHGFAADWKW